MPHIGALRRAVTPLLLTLTTLAACGGSDGNGPNDDDVFGTYTLVRAGGVSLPPQVRILRASPGPGAFVDTYVESGSFRLSENGTWAFEFEFVQDAHSNDPDLRDEVTVYGVEDSGTYTMQAGTITLDGGTVVTLSDAGVLSRSVAYNIPGAPATTVVYEYEK